jgi:hypothetical protein
MPPLAMMTTASPSSEIAPLFKADAVNIAVSASKDGKLRVVYGGWDDAKVILWRARADPAWRPQSDRPAPPLLVTSGEGGAYPATVTRHATSSWAR